MTKSVTNQISLKLEHILKLINDNTNPLLHSRQPRIVAVTKTRSINDIVDAYNAGLRSFGENYVQELYNKSTDAFLIENCPNIQWHFIGHLQGNKVKDLLKVPNLVCIETVDSIKLADKIEAALRLSSSKQQESNNQTKSIRVFVQINTSNEPNKSGIRFDRLQIVDVCRHIMTECPHLLFSGFMTIGKINSQDDSDFISLALCREWLADYTQHNILEYELSMGMSNDYCRAIAKGSTNVRIGRILFKEEDGEERK